MTGNGTIAPNRALNFRLVARLSAAGSPLGKIAGASLPIGGQQGGGAGIPFRIQGTTSKPEFIPDVGAMASSFAKGALGGTPAGGQNIQDLGKQLGGLFGKKK
jgi:hypothetical protein